ncbi:MAG TPA: cupin domain-containing protein [Burkholderiales bacterium]|nr:cupin domain-containing protein [Burkholderiales bacterium]
MHRLSSLLRRAGFAVALVAFSCAAVSEASAQAQYVVKPVAERKVKALPPGALYWRVETFPRIEDARAAAGWDPDSVSYRSPASLVADVAGKAWLFTLGEKGGATPGATRIAEVGPVPPVQAPEYLLRVNHGYGPPGARTPVHTHPGSEAFYVVAGRLGQRTPHGVTHVEAGQTMNGHPGGMPMEVFNSGTTDLTALIMFVVDATKPFSEPARFD